MEIHALLKTVLKIHASAWIRRRVENAQRGDGEMASIAQSVQQVTTVKTQEQDQCLSALRVPQVIFNIRHEAPRASHVLLEDMSLMPRLLQHDAQIARLERIRMQMQRRNVSAAKQDFTPAMEMIPRHASHASRATLLLRLLLSV